MVGRKSNRFCDSCKMVTKWEYVYGLAHSECTECGYRRVKDIKKWARK